MAIEQVLAVHSLMTLSTAERNYKAGLGRQNYMSQQKYYSTAPLHNILLFQWFSWLQKIFVIMWNCWLHVAPKHQ